MLEEKVNGWADGLTWTKTLAGQEQDVTGISEGRVKGPSWGPGWAREQMKP